MGRGESMSDTGHRHGHSCWLTATSGIPPQQPLFNGSACPPPSSLLALRSNPDSLLRALHGTQVSSAWLIMCGCSQQPTFNSSALPPPSSLSDGSACSPSSFLLALRSILDSLRRAVHSTQMLAEPPNATRLHLSHHTAHLLVYSAIQTESGVLYIYHSALSQPCSQLSGTQELSGTQQETCSPRMAVSQPTSAQPCAHDVQVTSPAFLPVPGPRGHYALGHGLAAVLNSMGSLAAWQPDGHLVCQVGVAQSLQSSSCRAAAAEQLQGLLLCCRASSTASGQPLRICGTLCCGPCV